MVMDILFVWVVGILVVEILTRDEVDEGYRFMRRQEKLREIQERYRQDS